MDKGALQHPDTPAWHALDAAAVLARLQASPDGLAQSEAETRLARFGPNALPRPAPRAALRRFLAQFNNLVIYVLLAAGIVTAFLGQWVDSGVIFGVVIINALIGFVQEGRAETALAAVRRLLSLQAVAIRDGRQVTLPAERLVPGDIILLQSGDRVPADARLLEARSLRIDEGMLTGESEPAAKTEAASTPDAMLGDRTGMAYSGTTVTVGRGRAVVVGTGGATEVGRISGMLEEVVAGATPLQLQLAQFARWLTLAIGILSALTWLFGVLVRKYPAADMFMAAVGLAVSAIPEALPAIVTITLAVGVRRMAGRNAIIRRLPAVETLGSVTVICSDKTGTLTRNEMSVRAVALGGGRVLAVSGAGYGRAGAFRRGDSAVDPGAEPGLRELCLAAVLCNESSVHEVDGRWELSGDPTEGALLSLAMKAGLDIAAARAAWRRVNIIPFESEHRLMATLHADAGGKLMLFVKGAPEVVLARCTRERQGEGSAPIRPDEWRERVCEMSEAGQRTLAIAARTGSQGETLGFEDLAGLELLGMVGIADPPREEALDALRRCASAGIQVKMVTGDHAGTAAAIARQMGIGDGEGALTGRDLERLQEDAFTRAAESTSVFARVSPEHKLRLVDALQSRGHVVAMTGDGVNDAPALKSADVGVAMGIKGTEASREAAQMVLADDNFASIVHAVEEGRTVFENIRKAFIFILPTNGGECLTILLAIALGGTLPVTPVQILWINMVTEATLSVTLAFEPAEPGIMTRPPRRRGAPILTAFMVWRILFVSALMVAAAFGLFLLERTLGADVATARTVAVNTLVATQAAYLLNVRILHRSTLDARTMAGNRLTWLGIAAVLLLQILFTYAPFMNAMFETRPLGQDAWLRILSAAALLYLVVELEKALLERWRRPGGGRASFAAVRRGC